MKTRFFINLLASLTIFLCVFFLIPTASAADLDYCCVWANGKKKAVVVPEGDTPYKKCMEGETEDYSSAELINDPSECGAGDLNYCCVWASGKKKAVVVPGGDTPLNKCMEGETEDYSSAELINDPSECGKGCCLFEQKVDGKTFSKGLTSNYESECVNLCKNDGYSGCEFSTDAGVTCNFSEEIKKCCTFQVYADGEFGKQGVSVKTEEECSDLCVTQGGYSECKYSTKPDVDCDFYEPLKPENVKGGCCEMVEKGADGTSETTAFVSTDDKVQCDNNCGENKAEKCVYHPEINKAECAKKESKTTAVTTADTTPLPDASVLNKLGSTDISTIIGNAIKALMGLIGSIALAMFVYGGVLWMSSAGNAERSKKGMQVIVWAALGIFMILASYAVVNFVFEAFR